MSGAIGGVIELCRVLAFYADRLDQLRNGPRSNTSPDNAIYLEASDSYGGVTPWYRIVDPVYAELDTYMRGTESATSNAVFAHPLFPAIEHKLHRIRAAYEFDREMEEARAILASSEPERLLNGMIQSQSYWALPDEIRDRIADSKLIAIAGSGPLPLTGLAIAHQIDAEITCFEKDAAASELARKIVKLSGQGERIKTIGSGIEQVDALEDYDAILGAVLLGVDLGAGPSIPKAAIFNHLFDAMKPGAVAIVRDPFQLGRLFYPALGDGLANTANIERLDPVTGPDTPYRSSFVVIRK